MHREQSYDGFLKFQWAPTLGGECYFLKEFQQEWEVYYSFNGHPPLGVNATAWHRAICEEQFAEGFNGHPPLGVNATRRTAPSAGNSHPLVSMGTHPWG